MKEIDSFDIFNKTEIGQQKTSGRTRNKRLWQQEAQTRAAQRRRAGLGFIIFFSTELKEFTFFCNITELDGLIILLT